MKRTMLLLVLLGWASLSCVAPALAQGLGAAITQITNSTGGDNFVPTINAAGTRIAFESDRDLTPGSPGNPDGNFEIFLYDTTTGSFTQITNSTGGFNVEPTINAAGTRIAFTSQSDLTPGSPGNPDGNFEIFLYDTTTGSFTQITDSTGSANVEPTISAAGTRIAFTSAQDLTPGSPGNPDGNSEIFLYDTTTSSLTQITNSTGGDNFGPTINAAGTRIAFTSESDLTPGSPGNPDGNSEIFLYDTTTSSLTQITNSTGGRNVEPAINAAGTRIAFTSNRDLTPGTPGNPDGNFEIFLHDTTTSSLTQITNSTGGVNFEPTMNADGTRIAFTSETDLTPGSPGNPDGNFEIFLYDTTTNSLTQITNSTGGDNGGPSLNAAGNRIAFTSDRDLTPGTPGNPDGNIELFLAVDVRPIPTLAAWAQIAMVALLLTGGLCVLRRRSQPALPS